jgi:hypothetical protein
MFEDLELPDLERKRRIHRVATPTKRRGTGVGLRVRLTGDGRSVKIRRVRAGECTPRPPRPLHESRSASRLADTDTAR